MTKDKSNNIFTIRNIFTVIAVVVLFITAVCFYCVRSCGEKRDNRAIGDFFGKEIVETNDDLLKVHFLDIGQGDCTFIQFPDGKNMLIDAGKLSDGEYIVEYIKSLTDSGKINVLLATHPDNDHIGGMKAVFDAFDIEYCYRPYVYYSGNDITFNENFNVKSSASQRSECNTAEYRNFLSSLYNEKCAWSFFNKDSDFSQTIRFDGSELTYSFDFFTPTNAVSNIAYSQTNDYSPICVLEYCDVEIMFTGDAEEVSEQEFLNYYKEDNLKTDVLKIAHHGSSSSTSDAFLTAVNPEWAIISCGENNAYGHPSKTVLEKLQANGTTLMRTDLQGNIYIEISPLRYSRENALDGKPFIVKADEQIFLSDVYESFYK